MEFQQRMLHERLNSLMLALEERVGPNKSILLLATTLLLVGCVYVRPAVHSTALGDLYATLSHSPLADANGNAVGYRILTPLVSYLIGLRGQFIIVTNLLIATALLALIYRHVRLTSPQPGDALTAAAVAAFSLTTLTTIYYGGYCDSATYVLIFLIWQFHRRKFLNFFLFFLGLLNRESIAFLLPWFIYLQLSTSERKVRDAIFGVLGYGLALGAYFLVRLWIESNGRVGFTTAYYLGPLVKDHLYWIKRSWPHTVLGFFTVFKALWVIPVLAGISMWKSHRRHELLSMLIILVCVWAQMVIAFDSSRMLTLGFMIVIVALKHILETDAYHFRKWAGWLILGNFLIPQFYTAAHIIEYMYPLPWRLVQRYVLGTDIW